MSISRTKGGEKKQRDRLKHLLKLNTGALLQGIHVEDSGGPSCMLIGLFAGPISVTSNMENVFLILQHENTHEGQNQSFLGVRIKMNDVRSNRHR